MHIQACTLICNLTRKPKKKPKTKPKQKCKTSSLERVAIALHTSLFSSPPTFVAQLMLSWGQFITFSKQAVFPSIFCQKENTPTLEVFSNTNQSIALPGLPEGRDRSLRPRHKQLTYQNAFCFPNTGKALLPVNEVLFRALLVHHCCFPLRSDKVFKGLDQGSREVWHRPQA